MRILDILDEQLAFKQNRLRTLLTAFGVCWGMFMLVVLIGLGNGLKSGAESLFSSDARDSIWIAARSTLIPFKGLPAHRSIQLTQEDVESVRRLPAAQHVASEVTLSEVANRETIVSYLEKYSSFKVLGVDEAYFKIKSSQHYYYGRMLTPLDHRRQRKVAVIGAEVARTFFADRDPTGLRVAINGVSFTVVGVFRDAGMEGRFSERIYVPISAFRHAFGSGRTISLLAATPRSGAAGDRLEDEVRTLLQRRHAIAPGDEKALYINNLARETERVNSLFRAISLFIWIVAVGTLTAGVVGISNVMIITVQERTREIGIRKALGASPQSLVAMIVLESILLTAVSGYLGMVLGAMTLELMDILVREFEPDLTYVRGLELNLDVAFAGTGLLVAIGAVAGLLPAYHAARVMPVEAMRSE